MSHAGDEHEISCGWCGGYADESLCALCLWAANATHEDLITKLIDLREQVDAAASRTKYWQRQAKRRAA